MYTNVKLVFCVAIFLREREREREREKFRCSIINAEKLKSQETYRQYHTKGHY